MSDSGNFGWSTPTFTALLNHQLAKVLDTNSLGDPIQTFVELRQLIIILPPELADPLVSNDIAHIDARIAEIDDAAADIILHKSFNSTATRRVLAEENLPLLQHIIRVMHANRLLVKYAVKPKQNPSLATQIETFDSDESQPPSNK